ncbi:hypothetical protein Hte_003488 [Hypoxylon texense]
MYGTVVDGPGSAEAATAPEDWQGEVDRVFTGLLDDWDIRLTTGCSMHIHVSTGTTDETRFTSDQALRIVKGVAIYEEAITKIMPADRKNNEWAMSNFRDRKSPVYLRQLYAAVPTHTWAPFFEQLENFKKKEMVYMGLGENKYVSWNFGHLALDCGTVEFRRPPGVRSAAEAKHWAGVALGFVSQAIVTDYRPAKTSSQYPSVNSLFDFVMGGIDRLGSISIGVANTRALVEDRSAATVHTAAELQAIARKKAEKSRREAHLLKR